MSDERDPERDPDKPVHPPRSTRRRFLQTGVVAATAVATGCGGGLAGGDAATDPDGGSDPDGGLADAGTDAGPPAPIIPPEEATEVGMFGIGVASGDVTHESAIVWTRYDGTAPLAVGVWEMDGETYARRVLEDAVTPAGGGFVHVDVSGLAPGRRYRYAFFEMDGDARLGRSAIGRFRAAIAPDAMEPLLFGAVSCTSNGRSKDTLERAGARADLDAFFLLGDTTYNDGAETLDEYRASWDESLGSPGWLAARRATSVLATWDDHEVDNNFDPKSDITIPTQVFFEHLPLRRHPDAPDRAWKSVRWGLTAEVFVLDCRTERSPMTRGEEDIYISREQMDWLKAGLASSPAMFKLIANSVPIGNFPFPGNDDRWEGYAAQRTEILSFIDDNAIGGVLWIGGDFHFCSYGRVSPSGPGATQHEVLAGPGAQTGNPLALILGGDQFDFASTTNNYTTFELVPASRLIRVRWHDASDAAFEIIEITYP